MQQGNYHHRNPYSQQQNGNAANGIIVDVAQSQLGNDTASMNGIASATAGVAAVDLYSGNNADDLTQAQPNGQQPTQAQVYTNLNSTTTYPAAASPNAGIYSGQYMVDANVQNIIGK